MKVANRSKPTVDLHQLELDTYTIDTLYYKYQIPGTYTISLILYYIQIYVQIYFE